MNAALTARERDEFLTKPEVAQRLVSDFFIPLLPPESLLFIEPSAGAGAFVRALPKGSNFMALDIHPQSPDVIQADFMTWDPPKTNKTLVVVGNPPFGWCASKAIQFVNRSASFAQWIAMVVPRTFLKQSTSRMLDSRLEQIEWHPVEKNAFEFCGKSYHVPCVFMIWKVHPEPVEQQTPSALTTPEFNFCKKEDADLSFQRVGHNAGRVRRDFSDRAITSHFFLKTIMSTDQVETILNRINWAGIKHHTAGCPSISKRELIQHFNQEKNNATPAI